MKSDMYSQLSTLNTLPRCMWGPVVLEASCRQFSCHKDKFLHESLVSSVIQHMSYVGLFYSCVIVFCICFFFSFYLHSHLSERQPLDGGQGWKCCNSYFMPLRSTWLAAMSMTLMMKAIAKAHIRLLRTQVCLTCCVGLEPAEEKKKKNRWEGKKNRLSERPAESGVT